MDRGWLNVDSGHNSDRCHNSIVMTRGFGGILMHESCSFVLLSYISRCCACVLKIFWVRALTISNVYAVSIAQWPSVVTLARSMHTVCTTGGSKCSTYLSYWHIRYYIITDLLSELLAARGAVQWSVSVGSFITRRVKFYRWFFNLSNPNLRDAPMQTGNCYGYVV